MGRFNYVPKIGGFVFGDYLEMKCNVRFCLSQRPRLQDVVNKGKLTILSKFDWCPGRADVFFRLMEATMELLDHLGLDETAHFVLEIALRLRRVYCTLESQYIRCLLHV